MEVKLSTEPNSGNGLFNNNPEKVGEDVAIGYAAITIYNQDKLPSIIDRLQVIVLDDHFFANAEGIELQTTNSAVFVQAGSKNNANNAYRLFFRDQRTKEWVPFVELRTNREVDPGEELFTEYGKEHWIYLPHWEMLGKEIKLHFQTIKEIVEYIYHTFTIWLMGL